jgi:cell division protein FtsB
MDIYIYSRGLSKGYSWVNYNSGENKVHLEEGKQPPDLEKISNVIDMNDFSVVIYRYYDQIILLITGIESSRTDNRVRTIHTTIAWVGQKNEESMLRKIAVEALDSYSGEKRSKKKKLSNFEKKVDEVISSYNFSDRYRGFNVDEDLLSKFNDLPHFKENTQSDSKPKIGNLSSKLYELIYELKDKDRSLYSLPKKNDKNGILVLVSPTVTKTNLENKVVWRGLSEQVEADGEQVEADGWISLDTQKDEHQNWLEPVKRQVKQVKSLMSRLNKNPQNSFIILFLVVSLSGNAFLYFQNNSNKSKIESLQSQIEQLKDKNQNLENQNQELKDKNQNLENQNQELQDKMNELRDTTQN